MKKLTLYDLWHYNLRVAIVVAGLVFCYCQLTKTGVVVMAVILAIGGFVRLLVWANRKGIIYLN